MARVEAARRPRLLQVPTADGRSSLEERPGSPHVPRDMGVRYVTRHCGQ